MVDMDSSLSPPPQYTEQPPQYPQEQQPLYHKNGGV